MHKSLGRCSAPAWLLTIVAGCVASPKSVGPQSLNLPTESCLVSPEPVPDAQAAGRPPGESTEQEFEHVMRVLGTLARLDLLRPELKSEMLAELSATDARGAPQVIERWRARVAELEASQKTTPLPRGSEFERDPLQVESPVAAAGGAEPRAGPAEPDRTSALPKRSLGVRAASQEHPLEGTADWEELLEALEEQAHELAAEPEGAPRARLQLEVIGLLRRSSLENGRAVDARLWELLAPAVDHALGAAGAAPLATQRALEGVQGAARLLGGSRRLAVRNLVFCRRVRGYGNVDRLAENVIERGQPVLLYSEVENFFSEAGAGGFRTRLSSRLEVLDATGRALWSQQFAAADDTSSVVRHDYFLTHHFRLPGQLPCGIYCVRLTLDDELGHQSAAGEISLAVR